MTITTQKIPSGYKQTEIGVIPADWDVKRLGDIVRFNNGKAHERFIDDKGDYIVVNSKFISTAGEVFKTSGENLSPLSAGDIAMVMSDIPNGKALAKCFFVKKDGKYTLNQRICAFKSNGSDSFYLFYKLNRNKYFLDFDSGVGQTNLKKSEVLDCPVALPADKKEQTSIAMALSDTDILIKKLEELIEKKKNTKQGVMQELLTGKHRLSGFSNKWEIKKLGDIFRVTRGQVLAMTKTTDERMGEYQYPVYSSQTKNNGLAGYYKDYLFENCITWTTDGANAGDVKYRDGKFYCTNVCGVLESTEGYSNLCVAAIFNSISKKYVSYVGNPKLMNNVVFDIEIFLPSSIKEQVAISEIIADIDIEIEKLESQLTKYQNIKQGMMQTLLTGKIRLLTK